MHLGIKMDIPENAQSQALDKSKLKISALKCLLVLCPNLVSDVDFCSASVRSQLNEHE